MIKFIKRFCNNLNWSQRDVDMGAVIKSYWYVLNLPMQTNNRITVDSFNEHQAHHDKLVEAFLDKYGNGWSYYLRIYRFS